jgi:hypothetical protein
VRRPTEQRERGLEAGGVGGREEGGALEAGGSGDPGLVERAVFAIRGQGHRRRRLAAADVQQVEQLRRLPAPETAGFGR